MKNYISRIVSVALVALSFVFAASAQDETISAAAGDKYVISAKAGGVNFVEGSVGIVRKAGKSGLLLKGDKLEIGDRVSRRVGHGHNIGSAWEGKQLGRMAGNLGLRAVRLVPDSTH